MINPDEQFTVEERFCYEPHILTVDENNTIHK